MNSVLRYTVKGVLSVVKKIPAKCSLLIAAAALPLVNGVVVFSSAISKIFSK
ncbi:MAG: hypothetical protein Q4B62_07485 [Clostridiaceae bacterium]|nr:hypothetical protein [Clostridiaceae bacterium]